MEADGCPLTGARLETRWTSTAARSLADAPSRGHDLKLVGEAPRLDHLGCPLTGARLETSFRFQPRAGYRDAPSRGHDLKLEEYRLMI